jgi:ABC-type transport system involved in cytochrome bd biosynthesis fused ATPase/permease subunit
MVDAQYFGDGLTNLNLSDLKGKLIAIEGTDGVGRSTHIEMLQEWRAHDRLDPLQSHVEDDRNG